MPAPAFDPVAATEALLASVPPDAAARSDAYFEGGYWLLLWSALWSIAAAWLLLHFGVAARLRALAERVTRRPNVVALLFGALAIVALTFLELPWTIYEGFVREHAYGLATQNFHEWLVEQGIALGVNVLMLAPALAALYALIRRASRAWWAWGGALAVCFFAFSVLIAPVYVEPLFNEYKPLAEGPLRDEILALARANGVPSDDVFVVDASRQTTRISANVSGLLGTARIALNDNLLRDCTPAEIRAVMAHEIGHYALGHVATLLIQMGLLLTFGFLFADRAFRALHTRFGARWGVRDLTDPAGFPLLYALLTAFLLVATPALNSIIRVNEAQADLFGLNAAREPDGFASVALKVGSYRKLAPGPLEELLMFDHPSGRSRILMAMRWKAEQPSGAESTRQP
jgi:STE24 endopeptidase